jgi:hypothetical protein
LLFFLISAFVTLNFFDKPFSSNIMNVTMM